MPPLKTILLMCVLAFILGALSSKPDPQPPRPRFRAEPVELRPIYLPPAGVMERVVPA